MATILIVEDDPHAANIFNRVLRRAGHTVLIAHTGLDGARAAGEHPVDLVLLDMNLPGLGGHTIAALIKRIPFDIVIVAVSASTDPAVKQRAREYGCQGCITTPIDTRTFAAELAQYLPTRKEEA
jgi:CheY-like chemotaxis protein